jgi:F-type H+-transporting ATPase subunit delta
MQITLFSAVLTQLVTAAATAVLQVATLRSAVKLEQEQQFLIAKKLQELTGSKNIKLKPIIDQSLIAGFVVEYGSSQIDLSVRGQIEKVAEELTRSMATA